MAEFKGFKKGVNLGGWLSQCNHTVEHYDTFITEEDIKYLSDWNIDHLRIPVDYNLVEEADGTYKENGFEYIANAIKWCRKYNLNVLLDLHKTFGYSFDAGEKEAGFFENEKYQERFYCLWEEFAKRYSSFNEHIAFELLNEVVDEKDRDPWNRIAGECIKRIRAISKDVFILVGGYKNNAVTTVSEIAEFDDENIVLNFHCYEPLRYTHQGAYWMEGMDTSFRMSIEDSPASVEYFENLFKDALETAKKRNLQLYCGEYGVIDRADADGAYKWYSYIHAVFEKYGISHAAWSYKEMDFGLMGDYLSNVKRDFFEK